MVALKPASEKLRDRAQRSLAELAGISAVRARGLLDRAGGRVGLALAMHFTGLPPRAARRALRSHGLRRLEMLAQRRSRSTLRA
jgi:N-acetylmuramic acid 6-phosphate etherase